VGLLLWRYIERHNMQGPRHVNSIAPEAMRLLLDHSWPGNVRELQNVIEYAFAVGRGGELTVEDLPPEFRESTQAADAAAKSSFQTFKPDHEQRLISESLQAAAGRMEEAARLAGMSRATFWRKRKKYGL
jgi:transcriptional regulator of acetoin/glycerol metabolism